MSLEQQEEQYIHMNEQELVNYMLEHKLIKDEVVCLGSCQTLMKLEACKAYIDAFAWRCYSIGCSNYKKRANIREGSIFQKNRISFKTCLKILTRYAGRTSRKSILATIDISRPSLESFLDAIILKMKVSNESGRKVGGPGSIVQIDEK